jgi:hypothetical protein
VITINVISHFFDHMAKVPFAIHVSRLLNISDWLLLSFG